MFQAIGLVCPYHPFPRSFLTTKLAFILVLVYRIYQHIETVFPIPEAARSKTTRLLGFWFRIPPGTSLVIVVLCQVEVSASG